ncbi:MAG: NHLP family bacteriocin export ABC transporter peptidase/permease/ATPase subunit [Chitinophagales bacterium]
MFTYFFPKKVKTPTILQMEALECGAAALGIILAYYKRIVPLEELRIKCGVSRDGSKASNMMKVARSYGLVAKGYRKEPDELRQLRLPVIVHWNFNHFLVVEGFHKDRVYLNDPSMGPRVVSAEEFDQSFTGIVLTFEPGPAFEPGGESRSMILSLRKRLRGSEMGLAFIVLIGLALVVPGLIIPAFTRVFVDNILLGDMGNWLGPLFIGMTLTAVLRGILTYWQQRYLLKLEMKLALSTSSQFFWHILRLPVEFFTQRYAGELSLRVLLNDRVATLLSGQLATTILDCLTMIFFFILMLQYDVGLSLLSLGIAVFNIIFLRFMAKRRIDQNQKLLQEQGKLQSTSIAGLQMIETIKASGAEADFFSRWAGYQAKMVNSEQELGVSSQMLFAVPPFLTILNNTAVLAVGGLHVMNGSLTIGALVAFQTIMASFLAPVNNLVAFGSILQEVEGDMNRLDDVLRYPAQENAKEEPQKGTEGIVKLDGMVEFRNVTFGYSRLEPPLLLDFSLALKPGERVALVGSSGSGKSTVARLLANLYEPWSGEIMLDGKRNSEWNRSVINNSLAMVDQEISMFEGSIRENLTLWDATVSDKNVIAAAQDASIHDDILSKKDGYGTFMEEGGRNMSGGQKQRLEIARALVANPSILVLDEATSALDPITEQEIDDAIRRRGCTCLIIAHRLSTIRDCNEIVVLDQGRIVQRGTHEQLINIEGPYASLIAAS